MVWPCYVAQIFEQGAEFQRTAVRVSQSWCCSRTFWWMEGDYVLTLSLNLSTPRFVPLPTTANPQEGTRLWCFSFFVRDLKGDSVSGKIISYTPIKAGVLN